MSVSKYASLAKFIVSLVISWGIFTLIPITYHLNLEGPMLEGMHNKHKVFMYILKLADFNDKVVFHINSPGGYVYQGLNLVNAIKSSDAHTVSINEGEASSAAAIVAISCDEVLTREYTTYMFHRPFLVMFGQKVLLPPNFPIEIITRRIISELAFPKLTEQQQADYIRGLDVVVVGKDFAEVVND